MRGPPMPSATSSGQRARRLASSEPASRSPEASPATIAKRGASGFIRRESTQRAMPRLAEARKSPTRRTSSAASGTASASAAILRARVVEGQAVAIEQPVHLLDRADALGREAAPAHALGVEAAHRERMAVDHHERRHVLRDVALEADHRVRADANELEQAALAADDRPVAELDVAGQARNSRR